MWCSVLSLYYFLQVVSSYFPLPQCIEGLKVLVESLFGATFHTLPMAPGESWHPDVIKMSLHHPDEVAHLFSFYSMPSFVGLNSHKSSQLSSPSG